MRKICLFTSTRADWGLLSGLARTIAADRELMLQLLISGTHLVAGHGETVREICAAGFTPDARVPILPEDGRDDSTALCRTMGRAVGGYGEALTRLAPDVLVLLGDRYETFCAAAAAQICRIPVAHIHGGETTEGAVDEAFRHSITKMSHLHFPCCEDYRRRIIQLGENPATVHNVGALGVENIRTLNLLDRRELAASLGFSLDKPFFLVTFHPVTLENQSGDTQAQELFEALEPFPEFNLIITGVNADPGASVIQKRIAEFAAARPDRVHCAASLGLLRYLSAMRLCAAVIGNSSSGIIEAPAFRVPTVNIGDRQKGRVRAASVIDCAPVACDITAAIHRATSPEFKSALAAMTHPLDGADTAARIAAILKTTSLDGILKKAFHDISFPVPPTSAPAAARHYSHRCLVVGYGSIGRRHAEVLAGMGCPVAVVSTHARLDKIPCYATVHEAVAGFRPDYVVVSNRTSEHAATLAELAACGFAGTCLVEKPIFAAAAQTPPAPVFRTAVGYPLRFHPLLCEARNILAGKTLLSLHAYVGQYLPTWRPGTDYRACYSAARKQGGGALRDLSHELDYLQHLGGPWKRVCATGGHRSQLEIETDDQFMLLAELAGCPDVVCHLDYLSRVPRRFCAVQYEGGTLWLDFIENRLVHNDQARILPLERNEMLARMHEAAFAPATAPSPLCPWDEALDTLGLIEAVEQSAQQGKWICHPNR